MLFLCLTQMVIVVFDLYSGNFHILNQPCIPELNPTWSWCIFFFFFKCWTVFACILLSIIVSIFVKILVCGFLSCDVFVRFWYRGKTCLIEGVGPYSFLLSFYGCTCGIWNYWVRGRIRAVASGLLHSHSNTGSKQHLRPMPQHDAVPNP